MTGVLRNLVVKTKSDGGEVDFLGDQSLQNFDFGDLGLGVVTSSSSSAALAPRPAGLIACCSSILDNISHDVVIVPASR